MFKTGDGVQRFSEGCLEGVLRVSGRCLKHVRKVSGRPRFDLYGPGRYLVVSGCCLDRVEGVWKVQVRCLEGGWKVFCWPLLFLVV